MQNKKASNNNSSQTINMVINNYGTITYTQNQTNGTINSAPEPIKTKSIISFVLGLIKICMPILLSFF